MCVNVSPALENVFAINDIIMKVYCPLGDMMMSHFEMISWEHRYTVLCCLPDEITSQILIELGKS